MYKELELSLRCDLYHQECRMMTYRINTGENSDAKFAD